MINLAKNNDEFYRFELAQKLVGVASNIAMRNFDTMKKVKLKNDFSLVTNVDRAIEKKLVGLISHTFPYDGIIGEEDTNKTSESEYQWTIDPIDGTIAYVHNLPLFSTLIGLIYKGQTILGVASFPALSRVFFAVCNRGAYYYSTMERAEKKECIKLSPRRRSCLGKLTFCHSGENYFNKDSSRSLFNRIKCFSKYIRSWGDAYGHTMVAQGNSDVMIDTVLKVWDVIPLKIILEESGNIFFVEPCLNLENVFQSYLAVSCTSKKLLDIIIVKN